MISNVILSELFFSFAKSKGPGGQHVNKVSSKVILRFNVAQSKGLTYDEKQKLLIKLKSKITRQQELLLTCETSRNQHQNKKIVTEKFWTLIKKQLISQKIRKPTKPTKNSIRKRLEKKKKHSLKKSLRKNNFF